MWSCLACGIEEPGRKRPPLCICGVEGSWIELDALEPRRVAGSRARSIRAADLRAETWKRDPCGDAALDDYLEGGFPRGFSALAWGAPGAGKSSFLYRWASAIPPALVVIREYGPAPRCFRLARELAEKAGANLDGLFFFDDPDNWRAEAERLRARSVVFDSLGAVSNPVEVTQALAEWAAEREGFAWSIAHATKRGDARGSNAIQYWPDATMIFRRRNDATRVRFKKSRFCGVGFVDVSLVR